MTRTLKESPRNDYLKQEQLRVESSPMMVEKFPDMKSMTINLAYFDVNRPNRSSEVKYTVNLDNARSVFRIGCQNPECVGGDFDLSQTLAKAVKKKETAVSEELTCQGWKDAGGIGSIRCGRILRYKLSLGYTGRE